MRIRLFLALSLSLLVLSSAGCGAVSSQTASYESDLNTIVQPYTFSFSSWEFSTLYNDIKQKITSPQPDSALTSQSVIHYFSYITELNTLKSDLKMVQAKQIQGDLSLYEAKIDEVSAQIDDLRPIVEQTIARQITETLAEQGIYNPLSNDWFKITFPPVSFKLEEPLYELIISPRDRIQRIQSITIKPDITVSQMEEIESSVDELNVSSLVVQIGGLGATYPAFVVNNADLRFTIDTAVEEWLHQYLAFKPLGFRYVLDLLGISRNVDIPTINETVAGIASHELGAMVYDKYYSEYKTPNDSEESTSPVEPEFDFNAAMREIRTNVDNYLAQGQYEQAEEYMDEQQQFLITKGYYIRKLNQAYFAFYGSYAHNATSVDPIGDEVRLLRENSPSLKSFIETASELQSSQDLSNLVSRFN
jgi:hypothetical protein